MTQNGVGGLTNGLKASSNQSRNGPISLPGVDEEKLKARIYAKPELKPHSNALRFNGRTPVQDRKVRKLQVQ